MPKTTLGERLRARRLGAKLRQKDLADATGRSDQQVWRWEHDEATPSLEDVIKLAALFGATIDELVSP